MIQSTSDDFFNQIDDSDMTSAQADRRVGGSINPFTVDEPVEVTIDGPVAMTENDGIEEVEAVFTINADDGRSFEVALGTACYIGDKADVYAEARGTEADKRTKDQKKAMKFAGISRSKLHNLLSAALPSYETRLLEKVGRKWLASDMEGNPMDKEQQEKADVQREAKLNKILAAWQAGEQLALLAGKKVVYTPTKNEKNENFPYHNFSAVNS